MNDTGPRPGPRVVFWGTYDLGKPRTRLLLEQVGRVAGSSLQIHADIWTKVEDKSQIHGRLKRLALLIRWLCAYPHLVLRYLRAPKHDAVVILYMGHLDVLMIRPLAWLRSVPVVWDVMLTMYETLVDDRAFVRRKGLVARLVWIWDWLALRAADRPVMLTAARRDLTSERFHLSRDRFAVVPLGAETEAFPAITPRPPRDPGRLRILFYAQFAPMHGLDRVIAAARLGADRPFDWRFIGLGQEGWRLSAWLDQEQPEAVTWVKSVPYTELIEEIAAADICIGLFGETAKARTAVPNKLFQVLFAGCGLVTRDTPAVREVLDPDQTGIYLVQGDTPEAVLAALDLAWSEREKLRDRPLHSAWRATFTPQAIGESFTRVITEVRRS